jgi:hypothetical protein
MIHLAFINHFKVAKPWTGAGVGISQFDSTITSFMITVVAPLRMLVPMAVEIEKKSQAVNLLRRYRDHVYNSQVLPSHFTSSSAYISIKIST